MKNAESKQFLLISPFERSGTTWTLDFVDKIGRGYTEIFKQHLKPGTLKDTDNVFRNFWLKNFKNWQEFPGIQIFKETSLFLDLEYFIKFFPSNIPTIILKRDLRGVVSSFKKGNLYSRWNYLGKFISVKKDAKLYHPEYSWIVDSTDTNSWIDVLISLYLINCLEISRLTLSKKHHSILKISYEEMVIDYEVAIEKICNFIGYPKDLIVQEKTTKGKNSDFNTSQKKTDFRDWLKILSLDEINFIEKRLLMRLNSVREKLSQEETEDLLDLGFRIDKAETSEVGKGLKARINLLPDNFTDADLTQIQVAEQTKMAFIKGGEFVMGKEGDPRCKEEKEVKIEDFSVSETPATNLQFVSFMNFLRNCGVNNEINGNYLFLDPYMHFERGGRIFLKEGSYKVLSGFENHPVNWVNWAGAIAFCGWLGMRLPKEAEWEWVANNVKPAEGENVNHILGDTQNVYDSPEEGFGIKGWWGNVRTWCMDWYYPGYLIQDNKYFMKSVRGASWNSDIPQNFQRNYKPYLIGSRSIGIRLVRNKTPKEFDIEKLKRLTDTVMDKKIIGMETGEANKLIESFLL